MRNCNNTNDGDVWNYTKFSIRWIKSPIAIHIMKFSEIKDSPSFIDMLSEALPIIIQELNLVTLPHIRLRKQIDDSEQPTFGVFKDDENAVYLGVDKRHPLDVLRTLIHELCHYKQGKESRLNTNSGETGSSEENEANARAGIIMRKINKAHPEYFNIEPISLS